MSTTSEPSKFSPWATKRGHRAGGARRAAADVGDLDPGHAAILRHHGDARQDQDRPRRTTADQDTPTASPEPRGNLGLMTTASAEQAVLDGVKTQLYIGRRVARRERGRDAPGRGPRDRRDDRRDRRRDGRRRRGGARRRARGLPGVPQPPAARARRHPAPRLRPDHGARRRPRAAHDARDGQADRRVQGRDRLRRQLLPLVRRGGGPHRRPLHGQRDGQRAACSRSSSPSARASSSRRGTSRWRWARARSARPSPPAARAWSSRPSRRRCRCSRSPGSSRRPACPAAWSTSSPRSPRAARWSR